MPFADNSQDGYVCVSVIEHIRDARKAMNEMHRTLRPGGMLLLSVPFMFPVHDTFDYWRPSKDGLLDHFSGFEIAELVHMGGRFSTVCNFLQRPVGNWVGSRYRLSKALACLFSPLSRFDRVDDSPLGFGVLAVKR